MEKKVSNKGFDSVEEYNYDIVGFKQQTTVSIECDFFRLEMWLEIEIYHIVLT